MVFLNLIFGCITFFLFRRWTLLFHRINFAYVFLNIAIFFYWLDLDLTFTDWLFGICEMTKILLFQLVSYWKWLFLNDFLNKIVFKRLRFELFVSLYDLRLLLCRMMGPKVPLYYFFLSICSYQVWVKEGILKILRAYGS